MLRFLVTNDDGITSPGLTRLASDLSLHGEVYVVAPAEQQSAKSQAITFLRPLHVNETAVIGAARAFTVDGTPADCAKWAIEELGKEGITFDYLFSGINLGANAGIAVYYSGTIAAAREGALHGVRSIAMSTDNHEASEFTYICSLIPKLLEMSSYLPASTVLSVNTPDLPAWEIKGVKVAKVAPWGYGEDYPFTRTEDGGFKMGIRRYDTGARAGNSFSSDYLERMDRGMKYDIDCIRCGYAAISPVSLGNTDEVALRKLSGMYHEEESLAVFVDVQDRIIAGLEDAGAFAASVSRFARCVNRLGMPSVIAEIAGQGSTIAGVTDNSDRAEFVLRREFSAWGSTDFARLMSRTSARRILLCGTETHTSVLRTALDFAEQGYDVSIIEDCCASRGERDHQLAIERMRDAGCKIVTCRAAIVEMLYSTRHPAAGDILAMLD